MIRTGFVVHFIKLRNIQESVGVVRCGQGDHEGASLFEGLESKEQFISNDFLQHKYVIARTASLVGNCFALGTPSVMPSCPLS